MSFPQGGGGSASIPFTTKGQLVVGGTGGTTNVFNVGADGQSLIGQSGQALGIAWSNRRYAAVFNIPGALSVSTGVNRLPIVFPYTILGAVAQINTAPTGASVIFDILKNATTIYTGGVNRPTIAAGANASQAIVAPSVTSTTTGDFLTVNISQVGSTVAGSDACLIIYFADTGI